MVINGQATINGQGAVNGSRVINGIEQGGSPPLAPTLLTAVQNGAGQIDLAWTDNSTDESGFHIERSIDGGATFAQIGTTTADDVTYSDTGLASGLYYYRVRAYNGGGESGYSNDAAGGVFLFRDEFTTPDAAPIASPRTAEPGPGTITFVDTANRLSIANGQLEIGSSATTFSAIGTAQTRACGLMLAFKLSRAAGSGSFGSRQGWSDGAGAVRSGLWLYNSYSASFTIFGANLVSNLLDMGVDPQYWWAILLTNGYILGYSSAGVNRILMIERVRTDASPQPMLSPQNTTAYTGTSGSWRVGQLAGNFATNTGLAVVNVASPASGETATGQADALTEFTWTPASAETLDLMVRRTDDNNCWIVRGSQSGGWVRIYEKNAGVETQRATMTVTLTVATAYRLVAITDGRTIKAVYMRASDNNGMNAITYGAATLNQATAGVKVTGFATGANLIITPRYLTFPSPKPFGDESQFLAYGDSKTNNGTWQATLETGLQTATGYDWSSFNIARNGNTVAQMKALIDADLVTVATMLNNPSIVLCNLGVNDVAALPTEATWKANYLYIVDAMNVKWPNTTIYIAKVWGRTETADCNTLAGWINDIVASRAFLRVGHDERGWLEGGDDGATMTVDGVHYSVAGNVESAAQWQTILGY